MSSAEPVTQRDGATVAATSGEPAAPELDYLTRDYAGFRRLILDRLAQLLPDWQERHLPDVGAALVDLLAYLGDHLSYYQDAVASEAYLGTARRRVSVRRHARLVDYPMHEGCNARAFVRVQVNCDLAVDPRSIYFVTAFPGMPRDTRASHDELHDARVLTEDELHDAAAPGSYVVFEPVLLAPTGPPTTHDDKLNSPALLAHRLHRRGAVHAPSPAALEVGRYLRGEALRRYNRQLLTERDDTGAGATRAVAPMADDVLSLYVAHNELKIVPAPGLSLEQRRVGASLKARCAARTLQLRPGDLLLFAYQPDPPRVSYQVVRLTAVYPGASPDSAQVEWDPADALPAAWLAGDDSQLKVHGNVLLVDHGLTVGPERLVPADRIGGSAVLVGKEDGAAHAEAAGPRRADEASGADLRRERTVQVRLARSPLTFAQPVAGAQPACTLLSQDVRAATPQLTLYSDVDPWQNLDTVVNVSRDPYDPRWRHEWTPQRDLLGSGPRDLHFVAELDDAGAAQLRFGDGLHGVRPEQLVQGRAAYEATYRVGNGPAGNVLAGSIAAMVLREPATARVGRHAIEAIEQPLPASGGCAPEPLDEVRMFAPDHFRARTERAITAGDYADIVMGLPEFAHRVQKAFATLRWNGARYEALIAIDPRKDFAGDHKALCAEIRNRLAHRFRRMGHDVVVRRADDVPVDLALDVTLEPGANWGVVRASLLEKLGDARLPSGELGLFHPDNLTFGDGVYLSRLEALAHGVPGVAGVRVTRLQPLNRGPAGAIERGVLALGPFEIACLPDGSAGRGRIELNLKPPPAGAAGTGGRR
jgi:hypothetical protein